jgi:Uma2 family endonuclease
MGLPQPVHRMTLAEFTEWEHGQEEKYEFVNGEVFQVYAMGGARREHNAVAINVASALKSHLRDTPCRAYIADMQVHVLATGNSFYPDVVVSCEPEALTAELTLTQPKVIIEVLSPTTANYDRSEKFNQYRLMPSLLEYVLIDPAAKTIDIYRRQPSGDWLLAVADGVVGLILPTLNFKAAREAVFEDV